MRNVKELQEDHIEFELDCFDRLYFNLYVPMLCSLGGIVTVIRYVLGEKVPIPAFFKPYRDNFVDWTKLYAEELGLKIHRFTRKEQNSKEEIVQEHLKDYPLERRRVFHR